MSQVRLQQDVCSRATAVEQPAELPPERRQWLKCLFKKQTCPGALSTAGCGASTSESPTSQPPFPSSQPTRPGEADKKTGSRRFSHTPQTQVSSEPLRSLCPLFPLSLLHFVFCFFYTPFSLLPQFLLCCLSFLGVSDFFWTPQVPPGVDSPRHLFSSTT